MTNARRQDAIRALTYLLDEASPWTSVHTALFNPHGASSFIYYYNLSHPDRHFRSMTVSDGVVFVRDR